MKEKTKEKKSEVYIRSDGWVFSKDGMAKLVAGGHKGFNRFKENTEAKLGKWHRVCKPLDKDAAAAVKAVKGLVARSVFVSSAIVKEERWRAAGKSSYERSKEGAESPAEFLRLTLTADAHAAVRKKSNPEFREFVSNAVLRQRKTSKMCHPQR